MAGPVCGADLQLRGSSSRLLQKVNKCQGITDEFTDEDKPWLDWTRKMQNPGLLFFVHDAYQGQTSDAEVQRHIGQDDERV